MTHKSRFTQNIWYSDACLVRSLTAACASAMAAVRAHRPSPDLQDHTVMVQLRAWHERACAFRFCFHVRHHTLYKMRMRHSRVDLRRCHVLEGTDPSPALLSRPLPLWAPLSAQAVMWSMLGRCLCGGRDRHVQGDTVEGATAGPVSQLPHRCLLPATQALASRHDAWIEWQGIASGSLENCMEATSGSSYA